MRLLVRLFWVFALPLSPMGGCAEVTTPQDIAPVTITVATYPGLGTPLENVQVCEIDTGTCVMSNADGEATLQIVVGKETSVTLDKEGYGSYLIPLLVPPDGLTFSSGISNDVRLATQHENVMSRYPPKDTGTILLHLRVRSFAGATFDLLEASAKAFYDDEEGWWDPDLTATTSSPLGGGGFVEVSSGVYHVGFGGTAERCAPEDYRGWPGRFENSVRFPVREGYLSHVDVICDEVEAP